MKPNNDYATIVKGKIENFLNKHKTFIDEKGFTDVDECGILELVGGVALVVVGCGAVLILTLIAFELVDYLN